MENKTSFYKTKWFMWVMLVIFAPVGIPLMWIYHKEEFSKNVKILLSVASAVFFIIILVVDINSPDNAENTQTTQTTEEPEITEEPTIKPTEEPTEEPEKLQETKKPKQTKKPKPTKKPSKKSKIRAAIVEVIEEKNLELFNYVPDNKFSLIKFKGTENLTNKMTVKGMYNDIFYILKSIQPIINTNVDFNVTYPLQDVYGNVEEQIVIKATFKKKTIKKIDFDNIISENIPIIADEWWNHPAINITD